MAGDDVLAVVVAGWILQDGNYQDFVTGTRREFGMEFFIDGSLKHDPDGQLACRPTGAGSDHFVTADVVHRGDDSVVLDFGWMAYAYSRRVHVDGFDVQPGDRVSGVVSLGVDPFFYFEFLASEAGMPPLIYEWDIQAVAMDVTPSRTVFPGDPEYPHHPEAHGPWPIPDTSRETWRSLRRTRTWDDVPNGAALYRLMCRPTGRGPSRTFNANP